MISESFKACLLGKDEWATSYYSELLFDILFSDTDAAEVKEQEGWYTSRAVQEHVYSVSYKATTDDKFLQNMMRSVDASLARREANLESIKGRTAEFSDECALCTQETYSSHSFQTSVIY